MVVLLSCAAIALIASGCGSSQLPDPLPETGTAVTAANAEKRQATPIPPPPRNNPPLIDDDGKTLWVSPTSGKPIDLGWLSPGAQIVVVLRPAALLGHPEGEKVRAALGPGGERAIESIEKLTGIALADMDRLVIGGHAASDGNWDVTIVVRAQKPIARAALLAKLPAAEEKEHNGDAYWLANERAYYVPSAGPGNVLVVAPKDAIGDIIDLGGQAPPLRRDIERLIDHTDAERHVTIIVAPNSLFSEGQSIFAGQWAGLRGGLFWFLGDELSGAALSLHWADDFFLELIATPTLDTSPERAARIFAQRSRKVPNRIQEFVARTSGPSYGQQLIKRFPAMLRTAAAYTRSAFEADHAVLRCYLPVAAGHNLLMAAELTLAESQGGRLQIAANAAPAANDFGQPADIHERLSKVTSLRFAKDTLEAALELLSQDVGVPIVIRGADLQSEGITKNQSFGIDIAGRPAEEILVEVLRLANPDKSATGPRDNRQKLVYVIEQMPDGNEQILVTTRARAAERQNQLPPAFRSENP
jgi:hypothetical protein